MMADHVVHESFKIKFVHWTIVYHITQILTQMQSDMYNTYS